MSSLVSSSTLQRAWAWMLPPPRTRGLFGIEILRADQHRFIAGLLAVTFLLNVFDGILTIYWITTEQAIEANPLMDHLLGIHPVVFMSIKTAVVGAGLGLLWRLRRYGMAIVGMFMLFMVYYFLLLYHLEALNLGLFS